MVVFETELLEKHWNHQSKKMRHLILNIEITLMI